MGGIVKKAKKVVKKVTKVVKKVVKGVGKVAKKVWKGVKGAVKKIGKVVKKMGPLASIAIGFIPGFQGLWANAGIWGAMGKGAITGFITSGGKLKGALLGAAGGGIGYGLNAGIDAYQKGVAGLGENATISEKITAGFKAVSTSTSDGVAQMYNSAKDIISTGDLNKGLYLTDSGAYVDPSKSHTGLFGDAPTVSPATDVGTQVLEKAQKFARPSQADVNSGKAHYAERMSVSTQQDIIKSAQQGGRDAVLERAKHYGYTEDVGNKFYEDLMSEYDPSGDFSVS